MLSIGVKKPFLNVKSPSQALLTLPYLIISLVMDKTLSDGRAKPTPSEPPEADAISVLSPISSPSLFIKAPPEFPLLIAASVWIMSRYGLPKFLPVALNIPLETEVPRL